MSDEEQVNEPSDSPSESTEGGAPELDESEAVEKLMNEEGDSSGELNELQEALEENSQSDEKNQENLTRILNIKVPFQVILSEKDVRMRDILAFQVGSLVEFEKLSDEHLDIYVNQKKFGFGEVVKIQEKFGIRVKSMVSLKEKIKKLGL